jgi:glycosyltransferase involved in cell wall biosynthesis
MITSYFPPYFIGGDAMAAYYEALGLADVGIEVNVITWPALTKLKVNSSYQQNFKYRKVKVQHIKISRPRLNLAFTYLFGSNPIIKKRVKDLLKRMSFDIIHFHNISTFTCAVMSLDEIKESKKVITLHDYWPICPQYSLLKYDLSLCQGFQSNSLCMLCQIRSKRVPLLHNATKWAKTLEKMDAVICPSHFITKLMKKHFPIVYYTYIPNGVPKYYVAPTGDIEEHLNNYGVKKNFIIYIGALIKHKGLKYLIKAFTDIERNDLTLLIVGRGPEKRKLQRLAQKLNVKEKVVFVGEIMDHMKLHQLYVKSIFMVLPSICYENNSMTLLEALSHGKPAITTKIGGNPEIIQSGHNGILVPPKDERSLASAIAKMMSSASYRNRLSKNAEKKYLREYTLKKHTNRLITLYKHVTNE